MGVRLENGVIEEGVHLIGIRDNYAQMMAQRVHMMYAFENRARWQPTNSTKLNAKHHHYNQYQHLHHLHHHHHLYALPSLSLSLSLSLSSLNGLL